ncbi:hypothetical protein BN961_02864 [Afipia felis]|uniref:Uncharacterized protein n=1 Tax=Afipia felis TaxID=1035 RepID=A0A090N833_AFIFE|nr:hypothetical protein BN961_02864 [Afipia felis]
MRSRLVTLSGSARTSDAMPATSVRTAMAKAEARSPDIVFIMIRSTAETAPRYIRLTGR